MPDEVSNMLDEVDNKSGEESEALDIISNISEGYKNDTEIQIFREYLRIPSVVSDAYDYVPCVEFLTKQANNLDLPIKIFYPGGPTKPIVTIEWEGLIPELPAIMLYSHMDVVPADEEYWIHAPFAADIDEQGLIFARGAQDMKSSGVQYLAALRSLLKDQVRLKRTIIVTFVPDAENGGKYGMKSFVCSKEFRDLKVGFVFDKSSPSPGEDFNVYFTERAVWNLRFIISGNRGHGSLLLNDTVGEKVRYLLDKFMDYRAKELKRLEQDPSLTIGDITSINLTSMNGGLQPNVILSDVTLCFDCRLPVLVNQIKFEEMIYKWKEEAGSDIEIIFDRKDPNIPPTILENNKIFNSFKNAMTDLNLKINGTISPFSSDSRYLRQLGIPSIGFSAQNHTTSRIHEQDEFLSAETYLKGIQIWKTILLNVGHADV